MIYDIAVIGAGVVGSLISMQLSQYNLKTVLIEKCNDVAMGTSKANSAIVHAGFDAKPGSLKAKLNVEGTAKMKALCERLHVPFKLTGSLVVAFSPEQRETIEELYERGIKNGVEGMEIIEQDRLREIEPQINNTACCALLAKTAGIVCPYELTVAAAETAVINGVKCERNFKVDGIDYDGSVFTVYAGEKCIKAKYVINCAGIFSGKIAEMIGDDSIKIISRKGEYMLLDKSMGSLANYVIFQCPSKMGKGILVTPTVDGNLLLGPSSIDIDSYDDVSTNSDVLDSVLEAAKLSVPCVNTRNVITSFAGLRSHPETGDFIISASEKNPAFINVAGIESPGLSASPAIAEYVENIMLDILGDVEKKEDFIPARKAPVHFRNMTNEERKALIEKDKRYGTVICRCETVTQGEILDAIHSPIPATDIDSVKRRTRAGMGRCQGGFCGSKVAQLIAEEHGIPLDEVTKFGGGSKLLVGKTK